MVNMASELQYTPFNDNFPCELIGEIASFLPQKEYGNFTQCSINIHKFCNTPNTLNEIVIHSQTHCPSINFAQYPYLKRVIVWINKKQTDNLPTLEKDYAIDCISFNGRQYQALIKENYLFHSIPEIRNVASLFIISYIHRYHQDIYFENDVLRRKKQINNIISSMLNNLEFALQFVQNRESIKYDNDIFPDDLKDYTERLPQIDRFLMVLLELIKLFPNIMRIQILNPSIWKTITKLLISLENDAVTAIVPVLK